MNESDTHNNEDIAPAHQERVLIEDYRGPLTASPTGTIAQQETYVAPTRWPDEPADIVPARRNVVISPPPSASIEMSRVPNAAQVASVAQPSLNSSVAAERDPILERSMLGLLLPIVAVGVVPIFSLPALIVGALLPNLPPALLRWLITLPVAAIIGVGVFNSIRALISVRQSGRPVITVLVSIVGLIIAALLLGLAGAIAVGIVVVG